MIGRTLETLPRRIGRLLANAIVLALALRVIYLFVRYVAGGTGTMRFDVESASLIFIAVGVAVRLARSRNRAAGPFGTARSPGWSWAVFCAAALGLYWSSLSVGFLSDDFVLLAHSDAWSIGPVTPQLFRPVPLLAWALLLHARAGAATLHALNIVLHGTNAFLTMRLVEGWVQDRRSSVAAGLLVLVFPLAPEAVAWCSGVFDVLSTMGVLVAILLARKYRPAPTIRTRSLFVIVGGLALLSKETAAVAAALVLIDAWARRALSKTLWVDCIALGAAAGVFGLMRLTSSYGFVPPAISRYLLQRGVFGAFGGLAVPWHVSVVSRLPWIPVLGGVAVLFLLARFFLEPGSWSRTRLVLAAAAWVLVSILPVWPTFLVAADLQGSRYLYLAAVGWAALVASLVARDTAQRARAVDAAGIGAVLALILVGGYGVLLHLRPWTQAAAMRDEIEASARPDGWRRACATVSIAGMPDSIDGAYVFRNGAPEALRRDLQIRAVPAASPGACVFWWNAARRTFERFEDDPPGH